MKKEVYNYILEKFFKHNVDLRQNHIKWVTVDKNGLVSGYSYDKPVTEKMTWVPNWEPSGSGAYTFYLSAEGKDCYVPINLIEDWHKEILDCQILIEDLDRKRSIGKAICEQNKIRRQLSMLPTMISYLVKLLYRYRLKFKPEIKFIIVDSQGQIIGTNKEPEFDYDLCTFKYEDETLVTQHFGITKKYKNLIPDYLYNGGLPAIVNVNYLKVMYPDVLDFCMNNTMSDEVLSKIIEIVARNGTKPSMGYLNWITVDGDGTINNYDSTPFIDENTYGSHWQTLGGYSLCISKSENEKIPTDIIGDWRNQIINKNDFIKRINKE